MKKLILSPDADLSVRWQLAFPDVEIRSDLPVHYANNQVVWLDLRLADWQNLLQQLNQDGARCLTLSLNPCQAELIQCLSAGARGYIHSLANSESLQAADFSIQQGGIWLGADQVAHLISLSQQAPAQPTVNLSGLSQRELEVARLIAAGNSNKQIAQTIDTSERTVKAHVGHIFHKLGIKDRLRLALVMQQR